MKVPLSWLKEYVEFDDPPAKVAERLTFAGIEVEGIETIGSEYKGIVVGEVRSKEKHPNADKLSVCKVFDGTQELQVVCGAPNVQAGGKYPFATIGTTMPDGSFTIKQAKLRGVDSFGMLCSAKELGLTSDADGLMVLDATWAAGTPLSTVVGPPETVFELEITPNRPDCLGIIGIAREIGVLLKKKVKIPEVRLQESPHLKVDALTKVRVDDATGCPRYTARILKDVKIGPSPDWMKRRLEHAGIRSINNVVDITNYVMLECGQPLHAFDQTLLNEGRIVVRRARDGETMHTLDGIDRKLDPSMLVIADATHAVAIAGVMGGAGSEIRDTSSTVLLESAFFHPTDIRTTSRKLGLSTESSYRFERRVDVGGVEWASRRAASLMADHAGATCATGVIDVYPQPAQPRRITIRFDRVRAVLGIAPQADAMIKAWEALDLGIEQVRASTCTVVAPTWRPDLEKEIDLIEEFVRIHGLHEIPVRPARVLRDPAADDRPSRSLRLLRDNLVALGLREIMNYSLVSAPVLDRFDTTDTSRRIVLPNPITSDQSVLRTSLVPQMVETLGRNRSHQVNEALLFEIGKVFWNDGASSQEELRLCAGLMGPVGRAGLDTRRPVDAEEMFLWAKGLWERLARARRVTKPGLVRTDAPWAESGYAVSLLSDGQVVGTLGLVKSAIRKEWRLADPIAVLDLRVATLTANAFVVPSFGALPSYPSVVRDVAMLVKDAVTHDDIVRAIRKAAPAELERVELFDVFRGKGIPEGCRSVAYSLTFRSPSRTLTDEETNGYHDSVKRALQQELQVEIR